MPPPYDYELEDAPDLSPESSPYDPVMAPHTAPDRSIDVKEGAESAFPRMWFKYDDVEDLAPSDLEKVPFSALQEFEPLPPGPRPRLRPRPAPRPRPTFKPQPFKFAGGPRARMESFQEAL